MSDVGDFHLDEAGAGGSTSTPVASGDDAFDVEACVDPERAAAALAQVLNGVITGEGPTTRGRIHFSRSLDEEDARLCERILLTAGRGGAPVSRAEAEVLFDIDAAAAERSDNGRFDDLFGKAVAHYMMAAIGRPVPPRDVALAAKTPLDTWVQQTTGSVDADILGWMASHMSARRRLGGALATIAAVICGIAVSPVAQSIAALLDAGA
jgi:hypothetical protein